MKTVIATRGGKGAYRIADKLDFAAAVAQPKLLVGFREITISAPGAFHALSIAGHSGRALARQRRAGCS